MSGEPELPEYPTAAQTGELGVRLVDRIVSEDLGWVFRDQGRKDFGIDALIEIMKGQQRATGRLLAAQIKCGASFFSRETPEGDGWVFRGENKHLNYWTDHSLPVVVLLCDPTSRACYYAHVRRGSVDQHADSWTMVVPRAQRLDAGAIPALERLVRGTQRLDLFEAMLLEHLVDRFGSAMDICPTVHMPRDFHRFRYLINVKHEGTCAVQCVDTAAQPVTAELIREEAKWLEYNRRTAGTQRLLLYIVGDDPKSIGVVNEVKDALREHPDVRLHRLLFANDWAPCFTELDGDGLPIEHWPE